MQASEARHDAPERQNVRVPPWLVRVTERLELDRRLDPAATALTKLAQPLMQKPAAEILRGDWLGHALHPLLTDLPLGCWFGAGLLDVLGGKRARPAAQRLVGLGLLLVPPTAAAGLVDSTATDDMRDRRVAAVHAAGNTLVAAFYFGSWSARRDGRFGRGRLLGLAGGLLACSTGYLGGHLSFGRGVGQGLRGMSRDGGNETELPDVDRLRAMATTIAEQS